MTANINNSSLRTNVMLFGVFSHYDSMAEVCDNMRAMGGKLNYLGMDCSQSKSTAGDALCDRDNELFKVYYFALIKHSVFFYRSAAKKR